MAHTFARLPQWQQHFVGRLQDALQTAKGSEFAREVLEYALADCPEDEPSSGSEWDALDPNFRVGVCVGLIRALAGCLDALAADMALQSHRSRQTARDLAEPTITVMRTFRAMHATEWGDDGQEGPDEAA